MPREAGESHGIPLVGEVLGPGPQGLRAAGEAVADQDADPAALGPAGAAERLGTWHDLHVDLLVAEPSDTAVPG